LSSHGEGKLKIRRNFLIESVKASAGWGIVREGFKMDERMPREGFGTNERNLSWQCGLRKG